MTSEAQRTYLSPPEVSEDDIAAVVAALRSGWVAPAGEELGLFEAAVCDWSGVAHAIALSSGTAGLHLALKAVGVERGDVVLMPTLTFGASAFAAQYLGAEPAFIDVSLKDWQMDASLLEQALTDLKARGKHVGAVLAVDLYGQCGDLCRIRELCEQWDVPLVEDAAEALGALRRDRKGAQRSAGRWGELGVFSFNGNKILTTSSGGVVVTDNPDYARRIRHWSTQSREPFAHYEHRETGYNYRMSNILAALGRSQMKDLQRKVERKKTIFENYRQGLKSCPELEWMPVPEASEPNYWLSCMLLPQKSDISPEKLRQHLETLNCESRPLWKPMHQQPVFAASYSILNGSADLLFARGICLPSGCGLNAGLQEKIIREIVKCVLV